MSLNTNSTSSRSYDSFQQHSVPVGQSSNSPSSHIDSPYQNVPATTGQSIAAVSNGTSSTNVANVPLASVASGMDEDSIAGGSIFESEDDRMSNVSGFASANFLERKINQMAASTSNTPLTPDDHNVINSHDPVENSSSEKKETYSTFIGFCFSINYIFGVGVLSLAYAFSKGGLILSTLFLLFVSVISYICVIWLLESIARAEALQQKWDQENYEQMRIHLYEDEAGDSSDNSEVEDSVPAALHSKQQQLPPKTHLSMASLTPRSPSAPDSAKSTTASLFSAFTSPFGSTKNLHRIENRKFEISDMMGMFLGGRIGKSIWDLLLFFYMSVALVSYVAVFGASFSSKIPLPFGWAAENHSSIWYTCDVYKDSSWACNGVYMSWAAVFGCIVLSLSMLNLTEQKLMQVSLTFFRYLCLFLMVGSIVYAIFFDPYSTSDKPHEIPSSPPYISSAMTSWRHMFNFSNFYRVMPTAIYSQLIHHSIPGLEHPVPRKHKNRLPIMFGLVFVTTFIGYTVLGWVMVSYYGGGVESSISLNFSFFRGGASFDDTIPFWVYPIVWTIILFPAIDVVSAYPLCAVTAGNNLHASFCSGTRWMNKRLVSMLFRLVCALPPLIAGLFVKDLSHILNYVGIIGIVIAYNIPSVLQIASMYKTRKELGSSDTVYSYKLISNYLLAGLIFIFGLVSMVLMFVFNVWSEFQPSDDS